MRRLLNWIILIWFVAASNYGFAQQRYDYNFTDKPQKLAEPPISATYKVGDTNKTVVTNADPNIKPKLTIAEEVDGLMMSILGGADLVSYEDRLISLLSLEYFYANGFVSKELNNKVITRSINRIDESDMVASSWAGITVGMLSNYVETSQRELIIKSLKNVISSSSYPLAKRSAAVAGLEATYPSVTDIRELLKKIGSNMDKLTFVDNDDGTVSFMLFKMLLDRYYVDQDNSAKQAVLNYVPDSDYPFTQSV
ncbi:MAG: hypothetical protein V1647_06335, partial [Pseudomonadota bacterium]